MIKKFKHQIVKFIEKFPLIQIFVYNNLFYFDFLLPHDKDYYALNILFKKDERRTFIDIGGNIGLSTAGFRRLGFNKNKIIIFEPDKELIKKYLLKIKKKFSNIKIYPFGLSERKIKKTLYKAYFKKKYFHFNNSFSLEYIKSKLKDNYGNKSKNFEIKKTKLILEKFDNLKIASKVCFIKIDVEGYDHYVINGMSKFIKKQKPVILVEYNLSNFKMINKNLKKYYDIYFYDFNFNKLIKLSKKQIQKLYKGQVLEKLYNKNSVNIFFINKKNKQ